MPSSKRKALVNILKWEEFKERLILEYGSLHEFGRSVRNQFLHLSQFSTKREVAEILAPKLKDLKTVIESVGNYHNLSTVQNIILNTTLNEAIVKCLPSEFNISYSGELAKYTWQDPINQEPVNTFYFNTEFIEDIAIGFKANPIDFDHASSPVNMTINAVHYGNPNPTKPNHPRPPPPLPIPIPISLTVPTPNP